MVGKSLSFCWQSCWGLNMAATVRSKSRWLGILVLLSLSTSVLGAESEGERLHVGYSIFAGVTAPLWATKEA